jgi:hypothetical protein
MTMAKMPMPSEMTPPQEAVGGVWILVWLCWSRFRLSGAEGVCVWNIRNRWQGQGLR